MKRKILCLIFAICLILPMTIVLNGCNNNGDYQIYYSSIHAAINSVMSENINTNESVEAKNAEVCLFVKNNKVSHLALMKDIQTTETIEITTDIKIDLNGKKLSSTSQIVILVKSGEFVIDGTEEGSCIYVTNNVSATTIKSESGSIKLLGGKYETKTNGVETDENPNYNIILEGNSTLYAENVNILSTDDTTGTVVGLLVNSNTNCELVDCDILSTAPNGMNVSAIKNYGQTTASNTSLVAWANHTANAAGTNYATLSRGVRNEGVMTLKNCYVNGTHSGISNSGELYIDGGEYLGYSHGGIYFSNANKTAYVKNATIGDSELPEGYFADSVAGTNAAGMYVGGADNITIYMDNCKLDAKFYPLVMKTGCAGNNFYISNSQLGDRYEKFIRLDTGTSTLYIGLGNNFSREDCAKKGGYTVAETAVVETTVDYSSLFPKY